MLITIITPSRNQGRYIKDCLESIHGQTHKEIEHIILDGMSTDDTAAVVAPYPSQFIQRKDTGPAQAINRGLDMANGEIVCWLNSDDLFFCPGTLESVVEIFHQHPNVDVVTGDGYYITDAGRLIQPIVPIHPNRMTQEWMKRRDMFLQPATFWRRNSHRLDEQLHFGFDWQLWLEFYRVGLNVLYLPQYLALYRVHPKSLTQQDPPTRRREIYELIAEYGDSKIHAIWCWIMWRAYWLDEYLPGNFMKLIASLVNRALGKLTSGKIVA
jgi:glycosyltransferase involved in cell wall biosynthesis